ncbi:MAG: PSP1 domain-containing protein [Bacteroidota bacterium]
MVRNEFNHNGNDLYKEIQAYFRIYNKLDTIDYLSDINDPSDDSNIVEVRFKNTRKAFYQNTYGLPLKKGDIIAVEAPMGHDIGMVSLTGLLAKKQFERKVKEKARYSFPVIYRKAHLGDLKRWKEAKAKEIFVRNRARKIARNMGLEMKVSDAEFRGDNKKVTFYYLADGRIDFRELIRHYASEFKVKIGMKQIGARQEAAMIGGFSSGGKELCGALWKTEFETVKISAAKIQQLPFTGTKLLGPSGALKTSLNYELDAYMEAWREFPDKLPVLETAEGVYYPLKMELLQRKVWYSESCESMINPVELPLKRVLEIINENKHGNKPFLFAPEVSNSNPFTLSATRAYMPEKAPANSNQHKERKSQTRRKNKYQFR